MPRRRRIAVFATEPVTGKIGGLGIRQLEVARELSRHFQVRLLTPFGVGAHQESFPIQQIIYEQASTLKSHIEWADVVYSISLSVLPLVRQYNKPLVSDLLVPEYFENLEGMPLDIFHAQEKCERFGNTISRTARLLSSADFFLVPTERGRDYYLGQLSLLGRLRPDDYQEDHQFRSLIDVAPFGIPPQEPKSGKNLFRNQVKGIGSRDFVILWGGSLANWFDAMTPLRAIDRLKNKMPHVKLVFTGNKHPVWGKLPDAYQEVVDFSNKKGLFNKNVFIYSDWVPYEEHDYYLTESDLGISTFYDHIENHFSFRIRVLDYLWGNLPIVTNPGNTQSQMIEQEQLGAVFPFRDDKALAQTIEQLGRNPDQLAVMQKNIKKTKTRFTWEKVLEPLVRFCEEPSRTPSLFDDNGVPLDRKQTSTTFIFDPEQFTEQVPHHPHMQLVHARQLLNENQREQASQAVQEYLDLFGWGLESHLFRNPLFGLNVEFTYQELLELVPDHPHASLMRAKLAMDRGDLDQAQVLIEGETSHFGECPEADFLQGRIYQERGWHSDAANQFQKVVQALPGHLPFLLPLADSLTEIGEEDKAKRLYARAWKESKTGQHSGHEWIRTHVALARARMDATLRPELETLNRYFNRDRTNETLAHIIAGTLELEGQNLVKNGESDEARRFYKKAWSKNGKTAGEGWIRVVAAMSLAKLESDIRPEVETLTRFLKRDPENERLAYAIASTYERQGRVSEARTLFEQFTTTFKDKAILGSVWYRLALLSPKTQKKQMVTKCLTFNPAHRAARDLLRTL